MTFVAIILSLFCQFCTVTSQLIFKHAMRPESSRGLGKTGLLILTGIGLGAVWFFLWMDLLQKWDLSLLYAFEALSPAIMAVAARVILKERLSWASWAGLGLICLGIGIVSAAKRAR